MYHFLFHGYTEKNRTFLSMISNFLSPCLYTDQKFLNLDFESSLKIKVDFYHKDD